MHPRSRYRHSTRGRLKGPTLASNARRSDVARTPKMAQQEELLKKDTQIGASISEFLRRGVAQAAPKPAAERPEMMPSKDGGFIATIQQGFQGIFGHLATSKEEVLKKRGPIVQFFARPIPEHLGEWLKIYRKARGEYEVSGEVVRMAWQSTVGPPTPEMPEGKILREVFVFAESETNSDVPAEPLHLYLRHSANVAYDLHFGSAMMKVPEQNRLSFAEEIGTLLKDSDADSKYKAMLLASEQALKRERAALSFRKKMDHEVAQGLPSPCDKAIIQVEEKKGHSRDGKENQGKPTSQTLDDLLAGSLKGNAKDSFSEVKDGCRRFPRRLFLECAGNFIWLLCFASGWICSKAFESREIKRLETHNKQLCC
eukprot:g31983.t1